ncbi:hypothetical protein MSTO_46760 [Mycobacterium stomatepiae]|uniref:Uncharacterized protein n=1 Tax=Mycobacterium stomatepiae TaxID=470076 RepID=A0A7I7QE87_9MYCO|nr:hypothetical protein MSTO_46760 [Mycobacterium stomatepiae]
MVLAAMQMAATSFEERVGLAVAEVHVGEHRSTAAFGHPKCFGTKMGPGEAMDTICGV